MQALSGSRSRVLLELAIGRRRGAVGAVQRPGLDLVAAVLAVVATVDVASSAVPSDELHAVALSTHTARRDTYLLFTSSLALDLRRRRIVVSS